MPSRLAALVRKDLETEARRKTSLWVQAGFTLAASVLVASAASGAQSPEETAAAGMILVSLFLSLYASLSSFLKEAYRGTLDGLRAAPVERWLVASAKLVVSFILILAELLLFSLVLAAFSPVRPAWPALLSWIGGTSLFLASVASFVSAGMAFAEESSGPLAMILLVLSIPYLRSAHAPLSLSLGGTYPEPGSLAALWGMAAVFGLLVIGLTSLVLE